MATESSLDKAYAFLKQVRESKTLALKPTPLLRTEVAGLDGLPQPFKLRYYQSQGIMHLLTMKRMVLGDATGLGKCVTGDTMLVTDRGLTPIWSLLPQGDLVEDTFYDCPQEVSVWTGTQMARVRRVYWNGVRETRRVETRNGYVVEGSLVHPLLVRTPEGVSFVTLPNLDTGDYVCIDRKAGVFPTEEPHIAFSPDTLAHNTRVFDYPLSLTPALARLLGYVVGEAWTNNRYATVITQHVEVNPEAHQDIRALLYAVFAWKGSEVNAEKDTTINVGSLWVRKYLEACGVQYCTSHVKEVPWCILQGTRDSVREFLRGLFEGEGSVADGGVEMSSSSEKLIRTTQQLLLRFGIVSKLSPKRVAGREHTYWRLNFFGEDARVFRDEIGFVSQRKQQGLIDGLSEDQNPNKDVVPYMAASVAALKDALLGATSVRGANQARKGTGLKQYGRSFESTLSHVILGYRNPTYRFLRQLLEVASSQGLQEHPAFAEVSKVVQAHYFYDPVATVREGSACLMDLEVDDPEHAFWGSGFINHNTIETIGSLCYMWGEEPEAKAIVVCPKSALRQWKSEIEKFTNGVRVILSTGSAAQRKAAYLAFVDAPTTPGSPKVVLLTNYHGLVRDWNAGARETTVVVKGKQVKTLSPGLLDTITALIPKLIVVYDEVTACKNTQTKTWQVCQILSQRAQRCYGLTATLLKNNLMEGFSIYKVIKPDVFTTKTNFLETFCVTQLQRVAGSRKIPIVVGYKNLELFRQRIDPYFLGRQKHMVSTELPALTTKQVECELSDVEDSKYSEALEGVLELGDGEVKEYEDTKALTSLIYCQEVADSLALLRFGQGSKVSSPIGRYDQLLDEDRVAGPDLTVERGAKETAFVDLLTSELEGEKVIVYTRFERMVTRLTSILEQEKIKSVRITGKEDDKKRFAAQTAFQNLKGDTNVVFITDAGSEAINLQAAAAIIFYDAPWSWGAYLQILGRMIRIGSPHQNVFAIHLVSSRPGEASKDQKTIDHHVLEMLRKKKTLIDKVIGEAAVGALQFDKGDGDGVRSLLRAMQGKAA